MATSDKLYEAIGEAEEQADAARGDALQALTGLTQGSGVAAAYAQLAVAAELRALRLTLAAQAIGNDR